MLIPDYAWIIFYVSAMFIVIGVIVMMCIFKSQQIKKDIELKKYQIHVANINTESSKDIQAILDNFIQECIDDYLATHPEMAKKHYITDDEETKLRSDIGQLISLRLSDAMYNKLSIYYNPYTMSSIIAEKIYIKITTFVVRNNTSLNE